MIRCSRCNRVLRSPVMVGGSAFGNKCAAMVAGTKSKKRRRVNPGKADPRQMALTLEVQP